MPPFEVHVEAIYDLLRHRRDDWESLDRRIEAWVAEREERELFTQLSSPPIHQLVVRCGLEAPDQPTAEQRATRHLATELLQADLGEPDRLAVVSPPGD